MVKQKNYPIVRDFYFWYFNLTLDRLLKDDRKAFLRQSRKILKEDPSAKPKLSAKRMNDRLIEAEKQALSSKKIPYGIFDDWVDTIINNPDKYTSYEIDQVLAIEDGEDLNESIFKIPRGLKVKYYEDWQKLQIQPEPEIEPLDPIETIDTTKYTELLKKGELDITNINELEQPQETMTATPQQLDTMEQVEKPKEIINKGLQKGRKRVEGLEFTEEDKTRLESVKDKVVIRFLEFKRELFFNGIFSKREGDEWINKLPIKPKVFTEALEKLQEERSKRSGNGKYKKNFEERALEFFQLWLDTIPEEVIETLNNELPDQVREDIKVYVRPRAKKKKGRGMTDVVGETQGLSQIEKRVDLSVNNAKNLIDFLRQANGRKEIYRQRTIGTDQKVVKYVRTFKGGVEDDKVRVKSVAQKRGQEDTYAERKDIDIYELDEEVKTFGREYEDTRGKSISTINRMRNRTRDMIIPDSVERETKITSRFDGDILDEETTLTDRGLEQARVLAKKQFGKKQEREDDVKSMVSSVGDIDDIIDLPDETPTEEELFTSIEVVNQDEPLSKKVDESIETTIQYYPNEFVKIKLSGDNWESNDCYVMNYDEPYQIVPEEEYDVEVGLSTGDNEDISSRTDHIFKPLNYGDRADEKINYDSRYDNLYYINPSNLGWCVNQSLLTIPFIRVRFNKEDRNYYFYFIGYFYPSGLFTLRNKYILESFARGIVKIERSDLVNLPFRSADVGTWDNKTNTRNPNFPNIIEQPLISGVGNLERDTINTMNELFQILGLNYADRYSGDYTRYSLRFNNKKGIFQFKRKKEN